MEKISQIMHDWFLWCLNNPDKRKPQHTTIYMFCLEKWAGLAYLEKTIIDTNEIATATGIDRRLVNPALNDLSRWGFIKIVQSGKNQYLPTIITISACTKSDQALVQAHVQALSGQPKIQEVTAGFEKNHKKPQNQENKRKVQLTTIEFKALFMKHKVNERHLDEWINFRKGRKAPLTLTVYESFIKNCGEIGISVAGAMEECCQGWLTNKPHYFDKWKKKQQQQQQTYIKPKSYRPTN